MCAAKLYCHFDPEPFELYPDSGEFWVVRREAVPLGVKRSVASW